MPPPRPRPADFRATFVAIGWSGIQAHYGAKSRIIARWIDEEGRDEITAERAVHVAQVRAAYRSFRDRCAQLGQVDPVATRLDQLGTINPDQIVTIMERQALA